jgi:hypothetical protein
MPDQRSADEQAPCALVDLDGGAPRGYAVLKDLEPGRQLVGGARTICTYTSTA